MMTAEKIHSVMEDWRNVRLPYRNKDVSNHGFVRFNIFFCLFALFHSFIITTNYRFSNSSHFHPYNVNTWIKRFICFVLFRNVSKQRHYILLFSDIVNCMSLYQIIIQFLRKCRLMQIRKCNAALLCFISTERIITQYQYSWGRRKESHKEHHTTGPEDSFYLLPSSQDSLVFPFAKLCMMKQPWH